MFVNINLFRKKDKIEAQLKCMAYQNKSEKTLKIEENFKMLPGKIALVTKIIVFFSNVLGINNGRLVAGFSFKLCLFGFGAFLFCFYLGKSYKTLKAVFYENRHN